MGQTDRWSAMRNAASSREGRMIIMRYVALP